MIPIPDQFHWYRPDTDIEYWCLSEPVTNMYTVVFVEYLLTMRRVLIAALLVTGIGLASGSGDLVQHTDYTQSPPVTRRCREVQCECGTEPCICDEEDEEDGDATCEPCHTGMFQPHTVSSTVITTNRRCKLHRVCTRGTLFVPI